MMFVILRQGRELEEVSSGLVCLPREQRRVQIQ